MHHGGTHAAARETRRRTLSRKEGNARLGRWGSARAQTVCSVVGHACNAECAALRCAALRCTARQALHCAARQALRCAALRCTARRTHRRARAVGLAHAARGAPLDVTWPVCLRATAYECASSMEGGPAGYSARAWRDSGTGPAAHRHSVSVHTVDNVMSLAALKQRSTRASRAYK
jgi:hypothetical protein